MVGVPYVAALLENCLDAVVDFERGLACGCEVAAVWACERASGEKGFVHIVCVDKLVPPPLRRSIYVTSVSIYIRYIDSAYQRYILDSNELRVCNSVKDDASNAL